jgi:HlyD family secretion protein
MKKLLPILIILIAIGAGGAVFYAKRDTKEPTVNTLPMSRGTIVDGVRATGTLQAVTTVTVGTQVSGIVQDLPTDFNDIVKKGQVIARLDPSILQTQVETANANLVNAQANLERQRVTLEDARTKLKRAEELNQKQLTTRVDLENAQLAVKTAEAQLKSTQSSIVQAEAAVNKAQVDLGHTIIKAPIDGIVIKRSVDKGQTVNAGMSAPELFIIAADLTKMQVNANIDETDVGRMRPTQAVTFTVDAYPTENFHGTVKQVRLNPTTVQNVVTYSTVIDVPNPELKLKPGMTASVTIEIARRENALRVPSAAIRFRPTADIFAALKQPVPPELDRGFGRGNRGDRQNAGARAGDGPVGPSGASGQTGAPGGAPAANAPATSQSQASAQPKGPRPQGTGGGQGQQPRAEQGQGGQGQGGGRSGFGGGGPGGPGGGGRFANMTPEERQKAMEERLKNMTPEERAAFEERRKQREANGGGRGGFGGQGGGNVAGRGGGSRGSGNFQRNPSAGSGQGGGGNVGRSQGGSNRGANTPQNAGNSKSAATTSATTIDALFAPLQPVETRGRVWLYVNKQLKPVELRLGITDGTYTEVLNDPSELALNTEVVISVITPEMASRPAGQQQGGQSNNPLMPQRGRGPGGPGGGRGGGR